MSVLFSICVCCSWGREQDGCEKSSSSTIDGVYLNDYTYSVCLTSFCEPFSHIYILYIYI